MKKVLVITPRFPYPEAGADEQDRAGGIRQLKRLDFDVRVIAKYFDWQNINEIKSFWAKEGVSVTFVPYRYKGEKFKKFFYALFNPLYLDGAAAEFRDIEIQSIFKETIKEYKPDIVWFDYTYLWPLYKEAKKQKIPIAVRSINVESSHFLDEDGRTLLNYVKSIPKYFSEIVTIKNADTIFAITPKEEVWYKKNGAKRAITLPLRALSGKLGTHFPKETHTLRIFFSGSTYTISHNYRALEFIVKELAPFMLAKYGKKYIFHITGAKLPEELKKFIRDNVAYEGFVKDMDCFLRNMDIAISPSFFGAGMQQKIFEPLARGFPTITHTRGIAGYPFMSGEDYLSAQTMNDYVQSLELLLSIDKRRVLSENCKKKSAELFSETALDNILQKAL